VSGLRLADIADLRAYERERDGLRRNVIALKKLRRVSLGPLLSVVLENRTTVRFQVQEMARAERILDDAKIQAELDVYNPLIPAPGELSMTLFVELTTEAELREWLPKLVGIERHIVVRVGDGAEAVVVRNTVDPAHASQLTRDEVTASVHYVKVALPPTVASRVLAESTVLVSDHPQYQHETELLPATKASVVADWSAG